MIRQYFAYEVVNEPCPECDAEVELAPSFTIQTCPNCKKPIKPCSMCLPDVICSKCELGGN